MKLLMDGRPLQHSSSVRGIGTYARGLLSGFAELERSPSVTLLLSRGMPVPDEVARLGMRVANERLPVLQFSLQQLVDPLLVARAVRAEHADLYHGIEFGQPLWSRAPVVMTVHDLIPFVFPQHYPWLRRSRAAALRLLRRADGVIADSHATASDLQRIAGVRRERITVVHIGIAPVFQRVDDSVVAQTLGRWGITQPYVLAVGTFDARKRIDLLADAVQRIRAEQDVPLVIAGDQSVFDEQVRRTLEGAGIGGATTLTGHVTVGELVALYSGASCLLFTSMYEGFGLPPLEAMACGTPAVVFDNSSLREVCGDAALIVGGGDTDAMAQAALQLLGDAKLRAQLRDRGVARVKRFTWRQAAEQTLAVYESVLQHR